MQRHTISKSALPHQANVLCCTITKIIEDCTGTEPNGLISTWLWFTCQSETETWQVLNRWCLIWAGAFLFIDFKFGLEGYIRVRRNFFPREGSISHCEFNLKFDQALNSLCWLLCNQNTFFYMTKRNANPSNWSAAVSHSWNRGQHFLILESY